MKKAFIVMVLFFCANLIFNKLFAQNPILNSGNVGSKTAQLYSDGPLMKIMFYVEEIGWMNEFIPRGSHSINLNTKKENGDVAKVWLRIYFQDQKYVEKLLEPKKRYYIEKNTDSSITIKKLN